jgi:hypothetical protein
LGFTSPARKSAPNRREQISSKALCSQGAFSFARNRKEAAMQAPVNRAKARGVKLSLCRLGYESALCAAVFGKTHEERETARLWLSSAYGRRMRGIALSRGWITLEDMHFNPQPERNFR